jgi:pimeloyl-ACP methyl ester carboxylesterase
VRDSLRTTTAPDGRTIGFAEWGDREGTPVFSLHGTPGSRMGRVPDEDALREAGLHVITYDRAGYGVSDRHPGRTVVDDVADVAAMADAIGLDRFYITGGSGGGPHSMAAAARLPDRVIAAEAVVSPVPYDLDGFDFFAGMDPENIKEFGWALDGEQTLHRELTRVAAEILERVADDRTAEALGDFELDESDRAVLAREDMKQVFAEMFRHAFVNGVWGWVDDDLALLEPWGFDVGEITVPITIRYGSRDVLVPAAHGDWLAAHVPDARVFVATESGHMSGPDEQVAHMLELVNSA